MKNREQFGDLLALTLVISAREAAPRSLLELAAQAFDGGAGALQLREKNIPDRDFYEEARGLADLCRARKKLLIINDRVDLALAVRADGVHLGQGDLPAAAAARLLPKNKLLGVSAGDLKEARAALAAGADYLGVGAVFPTGSKHDAEPVARGEIDRILALGAPTVAIGGVSPANAAEVWAMGFSGLAVISALAGAEDPRRTAEALLAGRVSR
ncbi:MAG: thiamine phosphate synthase [Candidatus Adiutrix sp.]|jgi:thiamine-phosphate pyrophosphorylase|nr:thiamine phosphate synthase [Candidatus Adiutrix sp.]